MRNAAYRLQFSINLATTGALVSGASSPDSEVSLDGGSFSDLTGEATEISSSGVYTLDLTAAENTGSMVNVLIKCGTANAIQKCITLQHEPALDSGVAQSATSSTIRLRSSASSTNDLYNGAPVEIVRGTGAGQVRNISDYVGSTTTATVDRAWATTPDSTSVYLIHPIPVPNQTNAGVADSNLTHVDSNTAAVAIMKALYKGGAISSSVNDASATTTSFVAASGLSATNDIYNSMFVLFTSGTLIGQAYQVTDYVGSTLTFTVSTMTSAPANGSEFVLVGKAT